jgi:hypothetical protein
MWDFILTLAPHSEKTGYQDWAARIFSFRLGPAQMANSLCEEEEKRTMRDIDIPIENFR